MDVCALICVTDSICLIILCIDPYMIDTSADALDSSLIMHKQVLTGDTLLGAKQVWDTIGMTNPDSIEGHSLAAMEADQFLATVRRCSIFAKVTPQQKVQIVTMLQKNDHIVGFLGDGTNDALALRQADVGVSVDSGAIWAPSELYVSSHLHVGYSGLRLALRRLLCLLACTTAWSLK